MNITSTMSTFAMRMPPASATGLTIVAAWIERTRQRRALARLDDHLLCDIGVSRSQVKIECQKRL
ncbi:MAG: DUF1127 domain-containing protein [Alphaproteobacteria bacterium]